MADIAGCRAVLSSQAEVDFSRPISQGGMIYAALDFERPTPPGGGQLPATIEQVLVGAIAGVLADRLLSAEGSVRDHGNPGRPHNFKPVLNAKCGKKKGKAGKRHAHRH